MATRFLPSFRDLLAAVLLTESVTPKLSELRDVRVLYAGAVICGLSVTSFYLISKFLIEPYSIQGGYQFRDEKSAREDLKIFDSRYGYSVKEAAALLTVWGPLGRLAYIGFLVVDSTLFLYGYRLVGVVFLNRCVSTILDLYPSLHVLRLFPRLPLYLAKIDSLENLLAFLFVLLFQNLSKNAEMQALREDG
jgi:hypothetical protein